MKLSVVTTLYASSPYIQEFYDRITDSAQKITEDYELIFVNDGSPDDSLDKVLEIYRTDPRVKVVDFSRNFGHHKAILAGLAQAKGERVFLIDSDLEEDPDLLLHFYEFLSENPEYDVAYGYQGKGKRKGRLIERLGVKIFYRFFNLCSGIKLTPSQLTVRLMKKPYVQALLQFRESEIFLAGIFELAGFRQKPIEVKKHGRGKTSYNLFKRFELMITAITSFTSLPLVFSFYVGLVLFLFSSCYGTFLIVRKIFFADTVFGWTSVMVSLWFLSGVILMTLGILGSYLAKIYNEVKNRPRFISREIYGVERIDDGTRKYTDNEEMQSNKMP